VLPAGRAARHVPAVAPGGQDSGGSGAVSVTPTDVLPPAFLACSGNPGVGPAASLLVRGSFAVENMRAHASVMQSEAFTVGSVCGVVGRRQA
jgi:hypothetical protein